MENNRILVFVKFSRKEENKLTLNVHPKEFIRVSYFSFLNYQNQAKHKFFLTPEKGRFRIIKLKVNI